MKKLERLFGILATILACIGFFFKYNHWAGAGIMIIASLFFFNLFYLPIQLILDWRIKEHLWQKAYIFTRFVFLFFGVGSFLFKIMHWPGSGYLVFATYFLFPVFLIAYFVRRKQEKLYQVEFLNDIILTIFAVIFVVWVGISIVNPDIMIKSFVLQEENYRIINTGLKRANNSIYETALELKNDTVNKSIIQSLNKTKAKSDSLHNYIKEFRYKLLETVTGFNRERIDNTAFSLLPNRKGFNWTTLALLEENPYNNRGTISYSVIDLKKQIYTYVEDIKRILVDENLIVSNIGMGLETTNNENAKAWENTYFNNIVLINVLSNLAYFENMAYLTENSCINALLRKLNLDQEKMVIQELAQKESIKAIDENRQELTTLRQKQELKDLQISNKENEIQRQQLYMIFAVIAIFFVIVLLIISTRAFILKQKDNKLLLIKQNEINEHKEEIELKNAELIQKQEEILTQNEILVQSQEELRTQKEELQSTLEHLKLTQAELIQSEKMASLGQLIAGIAHEINTPLGAINASITTITDSTQQSIKLLPDLVKILSENELKLFMDMVNKSVTNNNMMTSKEERETRKKITTQLEERGIAEADDFADILVDMGIYNNIEIYTPLFKPQTMQAAYHLSMQIKNSKNIKMAVERAAKTVFALKNYARYSNENSKVAANIVEGIETVLILYQNQLKHGIALHKEFEEVPTILCYPDELNQVWTNLIHNAIQAMDGKGDLSISVSKNPTGFQNLSGLMVQIADTGKGIPPEIKDRIFDAFFTTKPSGEGSGLGLYIVKQIIDKHKGTISFESEMGKGTSFIVNLPNER